MLTYLKPALLLLLLMTWLTGVIYPFFVTGLAQVLFPYQANGSLLKDDQNRLIGSLLIGQHFQNSKYFWGRPSATVPYPNNAAASGGSNLGPVNPILIDDVRERIKILKAYTIEGSVLLPVPVDLVTTSASGLDPHISPAAAKFQIKRVASSRHLTEERVQQLVEKYTEQRQWGFLGEPRVNVLLLNCALDEISIQ